MLEIQTVCSKCNGSKKYKDNTCPICNGTGRTTKAEFVDDISIQKKLDKILSLLEPNSKKK